MTSFRIHQVSLSMDKRLSRGGGRRLPDFCLSSTRPMPYFPRSWLFVLYLAALFQKCPRFFWVPCPVICLAFVLAGPELARFITLLHVTTQWSDQEIFHESITEPSQPTSAYPCRSYQRGQVWIYTTDPQDWSESWGLTSYVSSLWNSCTSTLSSQRISFEWAKAKTQNNLYWGSVERGGGTFIIFLITLNFHSASFKGNDFVCFLKLENKIWAYRRQTASTINSALQIHVLKLQLRRKCKKHLL